MLLLPFKGPASRGPFITLSHGYSSPTDSPEAPWEMVPVSHSSWIALPKEMEALLVIQYLPNWRFLNKVVVSQVILGPEGRHLRNRKLEENPFVFLKFDWAWYQRYKIKAFLHASQILWDRKQAGETGDKVSLSAKKSPLRDWYSPFLTWMILWLKLEWSFLWGGVLKE